jgi:lysophospholipase L1-like esterase
MDRRTSIGAVAMAALLAAGPASAEPMEVAVFGDEHSEDSGAAFPNWVTLLQQAGHVGTAHNFAESGARAAELGIVHFARQLRLWREAGRPVGQRVIVFLGANDVLQTDTFDASFAGYDKGLAELRTAGADLLLVESFDLGKTPGYAGGRDSALLTSKTLAWDRFVRGRGLPVVRLFDVFRPRLPDGRLFQDDLRLNRAGHAIIADAVRAMLFP